MLYPLTFKPIFKERVWGGRNLERLYQKALPSGTPIGESWEITDRQGDVSVIANGPLAGKDLHWLMSEQGRELLGRPTTPNERFPLLIKLLDAQDVLSLQVHPPAAKAAALKGEPKTEMWYIADAAPKAELYVGLKRNVTREIFESELKRGTVAECFHRVKVKAGDTMFLPSGRVHALGAGLVIFEIQQNSDTTYRVFDWNRKGLDGNPRELHIAESLESIDFEDFEPSLVSAHFSNEKNLKSQRLVEDRLFNVRLLESHSDNVLEFSDHKLKLFGVVNGSIRIEGNGETVSVAKGSFCLVPAGLDHFAVTFGKGATVLLVQL